MAVYKKNQPQLKRQIKFEPLAEKFRFNPTTIFPRLIKQETTSIAESHQIDEPIILPLMPTFCTPRRYISDQVGILSIKLSSLSRTEQRQ
jgi:hypothetical protein